MRMSVMSEVVLERISLEIEPGRVPSIHIEAHIYPLRRAYVGAKDPTVTIQMPLPLELQKMIENECMYQIGMQIANENEKEGSTDGQKKKG